MTDETTADMDKLMAELTDVRNELQAATARSEQYQEALKESVGKLARRTLDDYRMQAVLQHHLPDLDVKAEMMHAVGEVTLDEDGKPVGELSYRPAAPAQPPEAVSFPASDGSGTSPPAAPEPLTLPQRAAQEAAAAQPTGTTGRAAWDLRH